MKWERTDLIINDIKYFKIMYKHEKNVGEILSMTFSSYSFCSTPFFCPEFSYLFSHATKTEKVWQKTLDMWLACSNILWSILQSCSRNLPNTWLLSRINLWTSGKSSNYSKKFGISNPFKLANQKCKITQFEFQNRP